MADVFIRLGDFTITEIDSIDAFRRDTGYLDFTLEELQTFNLNMTEEKTPITGKNGRTIGYKKKNKEANGDGTSGVISAGLMKAQTGGEIKTGAMNVKRTETKAVTATGGSVVTLDYSAVGVAGAEVGLIKIFDAEGYLVGEYEQAAAVAEDKFSYDPATRELSLPSTTDITAGMTVMYSYMRSVKGAAVNNPSNKFSEVRELWLHAFGTDACDNTFAVDIHIPRADFSGEFGLEFGGDQTVHNFSFSALPDLCDKAGHKDLWVAYIYRDGISTGGGTGGTGGASATFATDEEIKKVFDD